MTAQREPAEAPRSVFDFGAFIADRTSAFTGREWVFAEIDAWLADPRGETFFMLTGAPGCGKSAIAARFVQEHAATTASHFCIARDALTIDPALFSRSISNQLCHFDGFAAQILKGSNIDLKAVANVQANYGQIIAFKIENLIVNAPSAAVGFVHTVLAPLKVFAAGREGPPLVIVVDGLDEAAQHLGRENIINLLANAGEMPPNVRWLVTSRPESAVLNAFEALKPKRLEIGDDRRDESVHDVNRYVLRQAADSSFAAALRSRLAESRVSVEALAQGISSSSKGNFLYAVWLLRAITDGSQPLADLDRLPKGLDEVYRGFLQDRLGSDKRMWRSLYRPVLGALATARAELMVRHLANFTGLGEQDVEDAVADLRQFLDPALYDQSRYQLYHKSVVDFLGEKDRSGDFSIELGPFHKQVAAFYRGQSAAWDKVDWKSSDDYGLLHLAAHLFAGAADSGDRRDLYSLICRPFMLEKRSRFRSDRAFTVDLSLALDAAAVERPSPLVEQVRLSLIFATLGSAASEVPGQALGALAWAGQTERVLDYITILQEDWRKILGFQFVAEAVLARGDQRQTSEIVQRAIGVARAMPQSGEPELRASWLGRMITAAAAIGETARMRSAIASIDDPAERLDLYAQLASALIKAGRDADAAAVASDLRALADRASSEGSRALVFTAIADTELALKRPDDARIAARQALENVRAIANPRGLLRAIIRLGPSLVALGMPDEALSLPGLLPDATRPIAIGLISSAFTLAGDTDRAVATARQAFKAAISIEPSLRKRVMKRVVRALVEAGLLTEARNLCDSLPDDQYPTNTLIRALAEAGHIDEALSLVAENDNLESAGDVLEDAKWEAGPADALDRALQLGPVTDPSVRSEWNAALALALARRGDATRAAALADRVIAESSSQVDRESLARTLCKAADALVSAGAEARAGDIATQALSILAALPYDSSAGRVLPDLIPALVALDRIADAETAVKRISDVDDRGDVARALAEALLAGDQPDRAMTAALAIESPYKRAWTFRALAESWGRAGEPEHALAAARNVLTAAKEIEADSTEPAETLGAAVVALGWAGALDEARAAAAEIQDEDQKASALAEMSEAGILTGAIDQPLLSSETEDSEDLVSRLMTAATRALETGAQGMAIQLAAKAEDAIQKVDDHSDRASRLSGLSELVRAAGDPARAAALAAQAIGLARSVPPDVDAKTGRTWTINPALPLIDVSSSAFHAGLTAELFAAARALAKPEERAEALTGIAAAIAAAGGQSEALDIWCSALAESRAVSRWQLMDTLGDGTALLCDIDEGETLWRICQALSEVESWWAPAAAAAD